MRGQEDEEMEPVSLDHPHEEFAVVEGMREMGAWLLHGDVGSRETVVKSGIYYERFLC